MVINWENGSFCVKMPNGGHLHATGGYSEGGILNYLEFLDVGGFTVGEPDRGSIHEKGSNQGFEGDDEGFLLLAPVGASESTEDVETSDRAVND